MTDALPDPIELPTFTVFPTFCKVTFTITTDPSEALGAFKVEDNKFMWTDDYESSFYALRAA